ncbi:HTH-type transcriptional regulator MalT [Thaumasiovibrio sp. DFM-14]|uniref:HTH-type transcriptional regulator MalT n=1 Tax=Thaumasiovibrio sp. DFM-14 TaxID=3384792 RepID=UPI0039A31ADC
MWIPSKLTHPARLHNAILRPRLLEWLDNASFYKLVLFRSPAGYGKTTLASQWLQQHSHTGWYNLDDSDNDTFHFANYFIRALNKATDNAASNMQTIVERRQFVSLPALFSQLFSSLQEYQQPTYLVLDDYHLIHNDEIHEGIRFFLKHMPDCITLILTSRTLPPLNTANLRVRDLLIEVNVQELAFDHDETVRFFEQRLKNEIEPKQIEQLHQKVEGWPSAMQLIALHARQQKQGLNHFFASMSEFNRTHLWDYLAEEVFDELDKDTKRFVLQCSVLDIFNADLVIELTGQEDALSLLESLNRSGLFLNSLEDTPGWFRFHHMFAEFLEHQRAGYPALNTQLLHHKAAAAWLKQQRPLQALNHAKGSNDESLLVDILLQFGWQMFNHGELTQLENAIDSLPSDTLLSMPKLVLLRCWLAQSQHRYNDVNEMLHESFAYFQRNNIAIDDAMEGEFNALRGRVAINQSSPQEAILLSQQALGQLPSDMYRGRIVATSVIGEVHHCLGQLDRALPMMQQTEKMARQYKVYQQALWSILQQAEILVAQGYVQAAFELLENGKKIVDDHQLTHEPLHEFLLRLQAQIYWCWNRLEEAEHCAIQSIQVLSHYNETRRLHAYSMLAKIALLRGERDKAERYINLCSELIALEDYHIDWLANANQAQMMFWQQTEDTEAIANWLTLTPKPDSAVNHFEQLQWRNIARAQMLVGHYDKASQTLSMMQHECEKLKLMTDHNRNLIIEVMLAKLVGDETQALTLLQQAVTLTNSTGMVANFLIEGKPLRLLLKKLLDKGMLSELDKHRVQHLIREMEANERSNTVHFDEVFIDKLISLPNVPEVIRTSPLTQREWQVLGLIYAGYSNEQIATELDVAPTTIKTHIRNLYQKLHLANRQEAIAMAESILKLMGV